MYALNLVNDGRILSACIMLTGGQYNGMPIMDVLPDGDISNYLYLDGEYIYDPLPKPEQLEKQPTAEERIAALEEKLAIAEILLGVE